MRVTAVEVWKVTMPLARPYSIAYQTIDRADNVFVRLLTATGGSGLGCAAPDPDVTGERVEDTLAALEEVRADLVGTDPFRPVMVLDRVGKRLAATPSARAAIDMALLDLAARRADLPLWKVLGGFRPRIVTSVTLGILPLEVTVAEAAERVAQGFRCLKLKGGLDPAEDAERVRAVRAAVGEAVALRFDANQGYTVEQARAFLESTRDLKLEILEQPTPASDPEQLGRVRDATVPVMADESLRSLADAFRIARGNLAELINIKVMKVGGILEALRISAVARAAGIGVMIGCGDESALGIAAGLAFALARPGVRYADLDGHLDLVGDPAAGAVTLREGWLYPAEAPGLGVTL
jgi:L-alanine-DL-glutamate epimerase-like enolase superfamily enzyme